jgi:hypothetical protein
MQAPPLRAVVPPLRESRWAPEWQRKILQRELLPLSFYRRLVGCDEAEQRLLNLLETEFDTLVTDGSSATVGHVYALRFPPMPGRYRSLVAAVASRYGLEYTSFDQDSLRFGVVYKHPASAVSPVLRLADFVLAASYYSPPPPPPPPPARAKQQRRAEEVAEIALQAEEVAARGDFAEWRSTAAGGHGDGASWASGQASAEVGYECEVAGCHEHCIVLSGLRPQQQPQQEPQQPQQLQPPQPQPQPQLPTELPQSRRPDGSLRPAVRVRRGYASPEEQQPAGAAAGQPPPTPLDLPQLRALVPTALALRALPDGAIVVFAGAEEAAAWLRSVAAPAPAATEAAPAGGATHAPALSGGAIAIALGALGAPVWSECPRTQPPLLAAAAPEARLLGAALWAREESPRRSDAEDMLALWCRLVLWPLSSPSCPPPPTSKRGGG